ncbi:MAG TPA: hypothetical protein VNH22_05195 [Blastocatellia bacterium]|jgi:uncharacterized membrane protein|nr:hypothetical protein [Blastocatellia bacterium]
MNSQNKMWLKIWSIVLGVFFLGCVTGAALNGIYRSRASVDARVPSIRDGEMYFQVLRRDLRLSPEQESAISQILSDTRNEYKTVCAEVRPRYNVLREHARTRIRERLLPDQQQQFDTIVTQENCNCPDQKDAGGQPEALK